MPESYHSATGNILNVAHLIATILKNPQKNIMCGAHACMPVLRMRSTAHSISAYAIECHRVIAAPAKGL